MGGEEEGKELFLQVSLKVRPTYPCSFQISSKSADEEAHVVSLFGLVISIHLVKNVELLEFCLTFSCFMGLMRIILLFIFIVLISN